ncbi:39S ribosomal protein L12, mitochondrial-like, partial [Gigantopelta aegis]|uniref:39S ribosomal protein L12, mitochondrial-like n=1 Tax=Gigantopelta aegis TaxID=1735272 RepID=UPI001B888511
MSACKLSSYCRRLALHRMLKHVKRSCVSHPRPYVTEAILSPQTNLADKNYAPKLEKIVDDISQLNLLEVADLNELLKKRLNIADAPMMAYGAMAAPAAKEDEEEMAPKQEKVAFTVKLMKFDEGKKVQLIKQIKTLMEGMNLVQAKKFVESAPAVVKSDITKEEAETLKKALTED